MFEEVRQIAKTISDSLSKALTPWKTADFAALTFMGTHGNSLIAELMMFLRVRADADDDYMRVMMLMPMVRSVDEFNIVAGRGD
mmetsp:Transcript_16505/g.32038  ORF Transcript_16505/g.32038 Transcript_16505/m.32038 type:complete len:84 (+) Transcript_16505:21-272(+)